MSNEKSLMGPKGRKTNPISSRVSIGEFSRSVDVSILEQSKTIISRDSNLPCVLLQSSRSCGSWDKEDIAVLCPIASWRKSLQCIDLLHSFFEAELGEGDGLNVEGMRTRKGRRDANGARVNGRNEGPREIGRTRSRSF